MVLVALGDAVEGTGLRLVELREIAVGHDLPAMYSVDHVLDPRIVTRYHRRLVLAGLFVRHVARLFP